MHLKVEQAIVNAQVKVNRAVFAMNAGGRRFGNKPTPTYILDMIHDAMRDLSVARRILTNQQRRGKLKCEVCGSWHTPTAKKPNHDCWKARKETNEKSTKEKNWPDKSLAHQASSATSSQETVGEIT